MCSELNGCKSQFKFNLFQLKGVNEGKLYVFDADHERRRKEQLKRLYERTPEQVYYIESYIISFYFKFL